MRAYFFGNMYFSSIQQGIQSAHCLAEMFTKYKMNGAESTFPTSQNEILHEWARHHKTMILLNGGFADELRSLIEMFSSKENPLPWAYFNESKEAVDNALTCVGIILPEAIYFSSKLIKDNSSLVDPYLPDYQLDPWELELATRLNNYGLAK